MILWGLTVLTGGCASTGGRDSSSPETNWDACRAQIPQALAFASYPGQTRQFLTGMSTKSGLKLRPYLDRYYQVLGYNLSSIALMLDEEASNRTSLQLRSGLRPEAKAAWLKSRIENGQSLFWARDIQSIQQEGEFLRVDLNPALPVHGSIYIACNAPEDRTIGQRTFVQFFHANGEVRKMSLVALAGWLENKK
jgi:hypothetical protein